MHIMSRELTTESIYTQYLSSQGTQRVLEGTTEQSWQFSDTKDKLTQLKSKERAIFFCGEQQVS